MKHLFWWKLFIDQLHQGNQSIASSATDSAPPTHTVVSFKKI